MELPEEANYAHCRQLTVQHRPAALAKVGTQ